MITATRPPKPQPLPVIAANIPDALKARRRWLVWSLEWTGKKWDKPPLHALTRRKTDVTDPNSLVTFAEALTAYEDGKCDGVGVALGIDLETGVQYSGFDFDDCRDPDTGEIQPWATHLVRLLDSYSEVSPSGEGVKVFTIGKLPKGKRADHEKGIECYDSGRYFTVTGNHLDGTRRDIIDRTEALRLVWESTLAEKRHRKEPQRGLPNRELALSALAGLNPSRAVGYRDWLDVGFALHSVDPNLCGEWEQWSQRCPEKFQPGECGRKWASFDSSRTNGIGLGSLIYWAKQDGWTEPKRKRSGASSRVVLNSHDGSESERFTDVGNARRLVRSHGADLRYCWAWGKWLVWDGAKWRIDDTGAIVAKAKATIRNLYHEAASIDDRDIRDALIEHARRSERAERINAMISLARSEPGIPVTLTEMDRDPFLLNVVNGTIDLRTGELRSHRREDLLTKIAPVEYRADATCPTWERFLTSIMADNRDLIRFLQRGAGYALTGDVREQLLFFFYGIGANGKSTFLNALIALLGDFAAQLNADVLMVKQGEAHPTALTDLFGRRFVSCVEVEQGKHLAEVLVKQLTGGDRIRARRMREDFWEFAPTHKVFLAANHKPVIRGTDHAIWRRIKLVPFAVTIADADQDKTLPEKLRAEFPGILAWLVRGCLEWQQHGLGEPDAVREATAGYRDEMDTLGEFLRECCVVLPDARVRAGDLHNAYVAWSGDKTLTQRELRHRLLDRGFGEPTRGSGGYFYWHGIGLTATDLPASEPSEVSEAFSG